MRRLRRHVDETAIASVVWHELKYGLDRLPPSKRRDAIALYLDRVVSGMPILDYDRTAAEWHARERARLAAAGTPPQYPDAQIAAIAHVNGLILVTFNEADFRRFDGLRVLNWL